MPPGPDHRRDDATARAKSDPSLTPTQDAPALDRRRLLHAAGTASALGVTATVLPAASAAASASVGPASYSDGSLDLTFDAALGGQYGAVLDILPMDDGRIVLAGTFTELDGAYYANLAHLEANGSVVADFAWQLIDGVSANSLASLALLGGDRILAGGDYVDLVDRSDPDNWIFTPATFPVADVTLATGATTFSSSGNASSVQDLAIDGNGRILVVGSFEEVGGSARRNLARLLPNGDVDTGFDANVDAWTGSGDTLRAVAVQDDGRIVIAGEIYDVAETDRYGVARLFANGDLDPSFDPNISPIDVLTVAIDATDGILVGGSFANVASESVDRAAIVRYHANGVLDTTFDAGLDDTEFPIVRAITVQPDGRLLIGGTFTSVGGTPRRNLARLHANGALDTSLADANVAWTLASSEPFDPVAVHSVAVDGEGRILVGGKFDRVGGVTRQSLARLA